MSENRELLYKVARKLYELFVVNRNAMAIQYQDGNYATKYTRVTENDVFCMLREGKSIGSYQQVYKSPYLKWICFDFDCRDKNEPNIEKLYNECTRPLNQFLDAKEIFYINEFSGRRGIHTWILFDQFVRKEDAYNLVQAIKKGIEWNYNDQEFGLDEFPATAYSKGNVVGLQVKIPLSKHKKGGNSFLFVGDYHSETIDDSFFERQLSILNSIKLNSFEKVSQKMELTANIRTPQFMRSYSIGKMECDSETVIDTLSQTAVYKALLERVMHGEAFHKDWLVMLGTLGKIGDGYALLKDIFRYCPTFSEEETNKRIEKYGKKYYPATFAYLYDIYGLDMEPWLNPSETGLQFLVRKLELNVEILDWNQNEITVLKDSMFTIEKERKYLFSNDEVPMVSIWDDLRHMTAYDANKINEVVADIEAGECVNIVPGEYYPFIRIESEEKERNMISLSAYDRVLTSHIALNAFYHLNRKIKSYSYNPNYISSDEMFYHWYNSWGNYISQIKKYIEVDLYSSMHVLTIDIKHFYDSIDFIGVYNLLKDNLSDKESFLFEWLIHYNEKLMKKINGKRIGVPQGPAYARLIAEVFLGVLIEKAFSEFGDDRENVHIYRYVDDIIIFHDDTIDSKRINEIVENILERHGLSINRDKSKIYGKIGELTEEQKSELLRSDQFQYGLRVSEYSYLTENQYITEKVNYLIEKKGGFNPNDVSFFFSKYADERAKRMYFSLFSKNIMRSYMGRGSGYQLFYQFIFDNSDILEECLERELFNLVPYNTINFSCLLAVMFYAIEEERLLPSIKKAVIERFVKTIEISKVMGGEDKSIIISLSNQEK